MQFNILMTTIYPQSYNHLVWQKNICFFFLNYILSGIHQMYCMCDGEANIWELQESALNYDDQ